MGCGATLGFGTVTKVNQVRVGIELVDQANTASSVGSSIPENSIPEDEATNCNSISPSPSVHSCVGSGPSLHSSMTARDRYFQGHSFSDDLKSDVPTIAESIADMQDFADLQAPNVGLHSARSTLSSSGSKESPGFFLDTRMHPLGVVCSSPLSEKSDSQCCTVDDRDLGGCSDVPTIRDDASVASAPSEICMSFPVQTYRSEATCQSGSSTPNRTLPHKSRSSNSRGLRRLHENHRKEHLLTHLDDAVARLDLTKPTRSLPRESATLTPKAQPKSGPSLAKTVNKVRCQSSRSMPP